MNDQSALIKLSNVVAKALLPLIDIIGSDNAIIGLMLELGWQPVEFPESIRDLQTTIEDLKQIIDSNENDFEAITEAINQVLEGIQQIRHIPLDSISPILGEDNFTSEFSSQLLSYLLINFLSKHYPKIHSVASLIGVIRKTYIPAHGNRIEYYKSEIIWNEVPLLINDPKRILRNAYGWGTPSLNFQTIFRHLVDLAANFELSVSIIELDERSFNFFTRSAIKPEEIIPWILNTPILHDLEGGLEIGIKIFFLPETATNFPGIALVPYTNNQLIFDILIHNDLYLSLEASFDLTTGFGILFYPENPIEILTNIFPSAEADVPSSSSGFFKLNISNKNQNNYSNILIGSEQDNRFSLGAPSLVAGVKTDLQNQRDFFAELNYSGCELVISTENSDSFIKGVLPERGVSVEFDFGLGFSLQRGVYFTGSTSLEIEIPYRLSIGAVVVNLISIKLQEIEERITTTFGLDIKVELGPLIVIVEEIGFYASIAFPGSGGNIGPIDFDLGFAPPTGLGFVIDNEHVKGGGYLEFYPDKGEYIGAAELTIIDEFSVKAIGIINTQLPDGQEGYSFLLVITAEFDPVQLGFGFTLSGVGGVIALHRSLDLEAIQNMVKTNDFDTVLFPQDPINNIRTIITSLNGIFPITQDYYSFGIMGELGWGTPALIDIKAGLMFQIPGGRIALVGTAKTEITRTKTAEDGEEEEVKLTLLKLQVNFAATYDPSRSLFSFDASLYQSELLGLSLRGDVAIRLKGGNDPYFLVSVGGFHPNYTPPEGLGLPAKLERIGLTILSDNPIVKAEFFLALTSNTVQFGAEATAKYDGFGFSVDGGLGFDALIKFSPLYFLVRVWGWMTVHALGGSFGVRLEGEVEGPYPLHFALTVTLDLWPWDVSFSFSFTKGKSAIEETPSVELLPILLEALEDVNNWQADRSDSIHLLVSTRPMEEIIPEEGEAPANEKLVVHPVGTISVRQDIMPAGIKIDKFGDKRPIDFSKLSFKITNKDNDEVAHDPQVEFFAPAQYFELKEEEKLSRRSYEKMPGGLSISGLELTDAGTILEKTVTYETKTIDPDRPEEISYDSPDVKTDSEVFEAWAANTATANSELGRKQQQLAQSHTKAVRLQQETFALVYGDDLQPYEQKKTSSEAEAHRLLKDILRENPELEDQLEVVSLYETFAL